jgi:hypothetical protein
VTATQLRPKCRLVGSIMLLKRWWVGQLQHRSRTVVFFAALPLLVATPNSESRNSEAVTVAAAAHCHSSITAEKREAR